MIVNHSTCGKNWSQIRRDGFIKPRGDKKGSWFTNVDGNIDLVYLSRYNLDYKKSFHGFKSALANDDDIVVILDIDVEKLNKDNLRIDENYLDYLQRGIWDACPIELRKSQRDVAAENDKWEESLNIIGACAYKGNIPISAVVNETFLHIEDTPWYREDFFKYETTEYRNLAFDLVLATANSAKLTEDLYISHGWKMIEQIEEQHILRWKSGIV